MNVPRSANVLIAVVVFGLLGPLAPLLISAQWTWWQAWLYALMSVLGIVVSRVLAVRRHPDIMEERVRALSQLTAPDTAPFERVLVPLVGLAALALPVAAGLQARFGPFATFPLWVQVASAVLIVAGYALGSWALVENRFFSGTVRIQHDRGHVVIDTGPYRFVRHPGYAGAILTYLGAPVLLDAPWAFVPAGFGCAVLVIRTALEDRTLHTDLGGYADYARRTRSRLLPGVW